MLIEGLVISAILSFMSVPARDLAEYYDYYEFWDQTERTATCYNWFEQYLEKNYDRNKDYSEGVFENNFSLTLDQATQKKYDYIFNKLELKPGMKLLDAGCGTGKWMQYCKERGVTVVGLTLSTEQAKVVREKGLEVQVSDYRKRNETFVGSFDRITALGSSEHVCSSLGALTGAAAERCNQIRIDTWKLFHDYLKPSGKFYVTVLTINKNAKWHLSDWMQSYILERHYGGYYSTMEDIFNKVVPKTGFKLTDLQDKTIDYHWSSIVDKDHFGHWTIKWDENTYNKISYLLKGSVTDPHLIHRWLYYFMNTWMWQFGAYQEKPLTPEQVESAPVQLKYFMLKK